VQLADPDTSAKDPGRQLMHVVDPAALVYWPAGQAVQLVDPDTLAKKPGSHG
jgi:hypothetical protein